jgi:hypothetical protein
MSKQEKHYEVGYRKPPKQTRFKKGNRGYPRSMRQPHQAETCKHVTSLQMMAMILDEKISVSARGKRKQMTRMEALVRSMIADAIKGDKSARRQVMALLPKLTESPGVEVVTTRVTEEAFYLFDQVEEDARTWDPEIYSKNEAPDGSPGPKEDR